MPHVVYADMRDLDELMRKLDKMGSPQNTHAAIASALNRTLNHIGAVTKKEVSKEYFVKKSLQKSVTKKKATRSNLTAEAIYTGKPIPLFVFKHSAPANQYRSPVTVSIKKSNGAQTHTGSNPAMFRAYGNKVKLRDAGQRNIRGAYTVSIPQMVANDDVYKDIAKEAEAYLQKRLQHELEWRLSKL